MVFPVNFRPQIWIKNFELRTAVHFLIANEPESQKLKIAISPYIHSVSSTPLVDDPENLRPQLWIKNFALRTAFYNADHFSVVSSARI